MKIQDLLVLTDLDGTLVTHQMQVPARNKEAIARFIQNGGRFSIATGRSTDAARLHTSDISFSAPAILFNGALIYDFNTRQKLYTAYIPAHSMDYLRDVLEHFDDIGAEVLIDDDIYIIRDSEYVQKHMRDEHLTPKYATIEELPPNRYKVLYAGADEAITRLEAYLQKQDHQGVSYIRSARIYYEMLPKNITKGSAVHTLAKIVGIPVQNIIAIGDYYNDYELLKEAGFAVCVQNAPKEIQDICDLVVGSCENGAVADLIAYLEEHIGY